MSSSFPKCTPFLEKELAGTAGGVTWPSLLQDGRRRSFLPRTLRRGTAGSVAWRGLLQAPRQRDTFCLAAFRRSYNARSMAGGKRKVRDEHSSGGAVIALRDGRPHVAMIATRGRMR